MTIITDSRQYRKAFLRFLLCAHEHAEERDTWERARNRTKILTTAATLGHMSTGGAGRSNTRAARADGPASYRQPGSSDFDSSQGSPMQMDSMRRAAQKGERTSYSPGQCFIPWKMSRRRELERSGPALGVLGYTHTHTYSPEKPVLTLISKFEVPRNTETAARPRP